MTTGFSVIASGGVNCTFHRVIGRPRHTARTGPVLLFSVDRVVQAKTPAPLLSTKPLYVLNKTLLFTRFSAPGRFPPQYGRPTEGFQSEFVARNRLTLGGEASSGGSMGSEATYVYI